MWSPKDIKHRSKHLPNREWYYTEALSANISISEGLATANDYYAEFLRASYSNDMLANDKTKERKSFRGSVAFGSRPFSSFFSDPLFIIMHLMYSIDAQGKRVYTLKKTVADTPTQSAHPARFSPDDKYSRERVTLKKRFGLLLNQQPQPEI